MYKCWAISKFPFRRERPLSLTWNSCSLCSLEIDVMVTISNGGNYRKKWYPQHSKKNFLEKLWWKPLEILKSGDIKFKNKKCQCVSVLLAIQRFVKLCFEPVNPIVRSSRWSLLFESLLHAQEADIFSFQCYCQLNFNNDIHAQRHSHAKMRSFWCSQQMCISRQLVFKFQATTNCFSADWILQGSNRIINFCSSNLISKVEDILLFKSFHLVKDITTKNYIALTFQIVEQRNKAPRKK